MSDKLLIKEAVIVEGKYDRMKLREFISGPIFDTGGFRVFKDKEKQILLRRIAEQRGILIMTDADSAGFVIRNFLRGILPPDQVKHAYIPEVIGVEHRKDAPSKEGLLGVEGIERDALIRSIRSSGAQIIGESREDRDEITKLDFYEYGLTGADNAAQRRSMVLQSLQLPRYLSVNAMIAAVNCLFTKEEFEDLLQEIK